MATDPDAALHRARPGLYKPGAPPPAVNDPGTLADTVERMPELSPVRPTVAPIEDPASFGEAFHASTRLSYDDIASMDRQRIGEDYAPIVQALGLPASENPVNFDEGWSGLANSLPVLLEYGTRTQAGQEQRLADLIRARRAKDPAFLSGVPDTPEGLRKSFEEKYQTRRRTDQAIAGRAEGVSGTAATVLGGIYGGTADPFNIVTLPIGGGGKTILQTIARETLVNGALEAIEQPLVAGQRAAHGETLSLGEAVTNTVLAGVGGGVFEGATRAVGSGVSALDARLGTSSALADKIYAAMPERLQKKWDRSIVQSWSTRLAAGEKLDDVFGELNNRELSAMSRAIVGEDKLTPDEQAAGHVLERAQDIGATSPYERTPAGDGRHEQGLAEAMKALEDGDPPPDHVADPGVRDPSSAPERPPEGQSTARRPQGMAALAEARLPADIYDGLKARGIPDHIARGAAAGVSGEGGTINALGPITRATKGEQAFGIGQWLGSRKAELIRRYGDHPNLEQQLDYMVYELKGGDAGGKSVLSAGDEVDALNRYIRDFMRPAKGHETDRDLKAGMAALGRGGEAAPVGTDQGLAAGNDAAIARLRADAASLDDQVIGLTRRPDGSTVIAGARSVPSSRILVDAERFQFKSGGDQFGVSDRLKGVTEFDPILSGRVILWEGVDGKLFVADGHQRVGLAKRISAEAGKDVPIDAIVLREADGVSAEDARVMAALKNMAEGTGSAVDAAKVLRDAPELADRLPPRSALVRDGGALARLSNDAFGAVYNGVIAPDIAAVIGHLAGDRPELHAGLVDLLVKLDPATRAQADSIVRQALEAGFHRETQDELFGVREMIQPLMLERAKVIEKGLAKIRKLGLVHRTAAREKVTLEATGSHIAAERSAREAQANDQAAEILQRLAFRGGPVADALNAAARDLAAGGNAGSVVDKFIADVRGLDLATLDRGGGEPSGAGRGSDAGETVAELRPSGFRDAELDPAPEQPSLEDLQAATERFSDPDGKAVQQQADSLVHDLKADLEPRNVAEGRTVFRGEHGADHGGEIQHRLASISFSEARAVADHYANSPNNRTLDLTAIEPRVIQAALDIRKPVMNDPEDPFIGLDTIERSLGHDKAVEAATDFAEFIEHTSNWQEDLNPDGEYADVPDYIRRNPEKIGNLYFDAYVLFDDPKWVDRFKAAGFDGAIHGGMGESALTAEFKVFDKSQIQRLEEVATILDNGDALDPAIAARQAQEIALRAASPLRPGAIDAKGEIGLSLFDQADQLGMHLGDESRALLDELDADEKAIKAIKDCL